MVTTTVHFFVLFLVDYSRDQHLIMGPLQQGFEQGLEEFDTDSSEDEIVEVDILVEADHVLDDDIYRHQRAIRLPELSERISHDDVVILAR